MSFNFEGYETIFNYGSCPPDNSKPFWEVDNSFDEDKVIFNLDLQASLQKLTPTEREIILFSNQGYSIREIAGKMCLPNSTVADIKDRAIVKLKEMMNGEVENIFI